MKNATNKEIPYAGRGRVMGAGIDYGRGMSNIDHETGIRYGVISVHSLEWWYDSAEADYGEPVCPECGGDVAESSEREACDSDYYCDHCEASFTSECCYGDEPAWHYGESENPRDGYFAVETGLGVFLEKSPYYTLARFCSPCAPGAGDLNSPDEGGVKTYCFGHDWFDGPAPYPVFSVETGALVEPPAP